MDLNLAGKRALVTGASKGIGRAAAVELAREGCDVVLVSRTREALEAAAQAIRDQFQVKAQAIAADLSRQNEVERVAAEAGEVDILVNNAGAIPAGDLIAVDDGAFRAAWDLKVFGYISLSRALYPVLKARRGVIVNVIGAAGEWLIPDYICGSVGNAALMAFTKTLARGAVKDGVRVVGINPGPTATERMEGRLRAQAQEQFGDPDRWMELTRNMAFGRPATAEEIAAAVAFLASPRSAYTTGTILSIDAGTR
jgi:NAD(P)-dependent dehydrogenase (short-subunit alcohol dehydrogenase family)